MVRGGGMARALCAAGLLLSGLAPAAQAGVRGLPRLAWHQRTMGTAAPRSPGQETGAPDRLSG